MNRPTYVVDASVAVKWVLPEVDQSRAFRIQEMYQDEEIDLVAPYLLIAEIGNVLWKRVCRGELPQPAAIRCFQQLLKDSPILLDSPAVNQSALHLALAHDQTVYDCLYLAWALEQRCDLITADERFFHAIRQAFPCVRLLELFEGIP
jgi:predicted nucleic acid-binding protein